MIQHFSVLAALISIGIASASEPNAVRVFFSDVDQNSLSTARKRVTLVAIVTRENQARARELGDRIPDAFLGNPDFQMITIINLRGKIPAPVHAVTTAIIRRRLDAEAQRLQRIYSRKNIKRNARGDLHAVADFDGEIAARFGLQRDSTAFAALLFADDGRLIRRWDDVPSREGLHAAMNAAWPH